MSSSLPVYRAKSVRLQSQSYYVNESGDRVPSVSTILNATRPFEQREALLRWRQRVGTVEANRISTTASRRGTGTHKQLERYLSGKEVVCAENVRPYWDSLQSVLPAITNVQLVEGFVFHDQLGYGGKADCVANYQDVPCLCEWKTGDRSRGTIDHLNPDYPLQVAAYWGAVNRCYRDYLKLDHAVLVLAIPELPAEVFWFEPEAIAPYWQAWETRVHLYWQQATH